VGARHRRARLAATLTSGSSPLSGRQLGWRPVRNPATPEDLVRYPYTRDLLCKENASAPLIRVDQRVVLRAHANDALWLTAMAGRYPDQTAADRFPIDGLAALSTTAFHPVTLSPTRAGAIWRQGIDGRRVREAPPSGAGITDAARSAITQYSASPMFSAPTATSGLGEPLFAFHHVAADYRVTSPPPPPSDQPWQQLDPPMPNVPLSCDAAMPSAAIRNSGARPTQATAIIDFHGARWTEYADANNNILRTHRIFQASTVGSRLRMPR
jgi:hypothetical protein